MALWALFYMTTYICVPAGGNYLISLISFIVLTVIESWRKDIISAERYHLFSLSLSLNVLFLWWAGLGEGLKRLERSCYSTISFQSFVFFDKLLIE